MKQVIGFAGRKRSGKGAICQHLKEDRGATVVTVANALKQLCCELIGVESIDLLNQLKDDPDSYINLFVSNKNIWTLILAKELGFNLDDDLSELYDIVSGYIDKKTSTVRELLQFVGTDIIRHFNPNWHVEKLVESINNAPTDLVVVDDIRFPNEKKVIEDLNGHVFFIIRPDLSIDISNHESETSLTWQDFDDNHIILNMFSLEYIFKEFDFYMDNGFIFGSYCPLFKHGACMYEDVDPNLGYKDNEDFTKLLIQSIGNNGAIVIHSTDEFQARMLAKKIFNKYVKVEGQLSTIVFWNPYVIENLKLFM